MINLNAQRITDMLLKEFDLSMVLTLLVDSQTRLIKNANNELDMRFFYNQKDSLVEFRNLMKDMERVRYVNQPDIKKGLG